MTRRFAYAILLVTWIAGSGALAAPMGQTAEVQKLLAQIKAKDSGQLAVSEEDGRFLRLLVAYERRKRALEIGGASGYSAIWMAQGLRETKGKLVTIEYDPGSRARNSRENIRKAGMSDIVRVVAGDAFAEIPKLPGTFDFVFLDAWKTRLQALPRSGLPRLDTRRPVHRAQRGQQAQRDGGFPGRDSAQPGALDDDRGAVRGRNLGVVER